MITIPDNSPVTIKTNLGTLVITILPFDNISIQTFQRDGKREYLLGNNILDGKLVEVK